MVLEGVLSKLPFSPHRIVRVEDGVVWVAGTLGGNRAELVVGYDVRTGQQVNAPVAGPPRLGIEAPMAPAWPARISLRERETGKEVGRVDLLGTMSVVPLHFVMDGDHVLVVNDQAQMVVVEASTLRIVRTVALPGPETLVKRLPSLLRAGGQSWLVRGAGSDGASPSGVRRATLIAPLDPIAGETGAPLVFEGRALAIAGADAGILVISDRDGALVAEIAPLPFGGEIASGLPQSGAPGAGTPSLARFELPLASARCSAAHGSSFAIADGGSVHLVEVGSGAFSWHRLPLPEGHDAVDIGLDGGAILVVSGRDLLCLEQPPFASGGPHASDLSLRAAPPPGVSPIPGVVVFAGSSLVAIDHPEYKRVNLRPRPGGAPYAKGQKVYFDQVEIPPTGVVAAIAWHREGEPVPRRPEPPPLVISGEHLRAIVAPPRAPAIPGAPQSAPSTRVDQSRSTDSLPLVAALDRLARELGFSPSPLLREVVLRRDADGWFAELLRGLGLDLALRDASSATEFWPHADPCLSDLATDGDGNAVCFYDYPPLRGAPPPVVHWVHDDSPNVQWRGGDFETFFSDWLFRALPHARGSVAAVLGELGLPGSWPRACQSLPPSWLSATFDPPDLPAIAAAEKAGDLLRAERLLVGAVTQTYDLAAGRPLVERLSSVYEALGWQRQLATLRSGRDG